MSIWSTQLNGVLRIDPDADALEFAGRWHRWGELAHAVRQVQQCLAELGLGADSRVGVILRGRPGPLAAMLATIAADACLVAINPLFPDDRLAEDIIKLRLPVVIAVREDLDRPDVLKALEASGAAVIMVDGLLGDAVFEPGFSRIRGADILASNPGVIIEMLTSGTTGPPKRIPLKRRSLEKSFIGALSYEKGRSIDDPPRLRSGVAILNAPLTHIGGLWGALTSMVDGRKACLLERFDLTEWHSAIVRHRPKVAGGVPAMLRMILDANIPKEDFSSLVALRTGAAPVDPATVDEFWNRYGIPVLQNYGATEFAGAVAGWTREDFLAYRESKLASVGRFQQGVVGRVVDAESGAALATGQQGILEVKSQQFGDDAAWIRTTDRASIDADGFLYIHGRADNAIVRGGFKIHPDDVARAIELHPAVREAVVVGIDDKRLGAVPVAAVMLKAQAEPPADGEIAAFLRERLLPYQVPVEFRIVDDVPRTDSLKPALMRVRDLFTEPARA
jgi:long-chain acyl-CoA synthetase